MQIIHKSKYLVRKNIQKKQPHFKIGIGVYAETF